MPVRRSIRIDKKPERVRVKRGRGPRVAPPKLSPPGVIPGGTLPGQTASSGIDQRVKEEEAPYNAEDD